MRLPSFASAASVVAIASLVVADSDAEKPSDVLSVTQDTFDSTVNPEALILVEFYAPWYVGHPVLLRHQTQLTTAGVVTARRWLRIMKRQLPA